MDISFHGAAGGVTGSCFLIRAANKHILIDCGMFQGMDASDDHEFGFEPSSIDYVLITHAHLDHCGRLPLLVKQGFHGEIILTAPTRALMAIVLADAASLQIEEAERASRRRRRQGKSLPTALFDMPDVFDTMELVGRLPRYQQPFELCPGIRVTLGDAGHILGSAWILLDVEEQGKQQRIVFSGDLGNRARPLLDPPTPAPKADYVVMESTYGERVHKSIEASIQELKDAVLHTFDRGGNVVIPTFALERAQEILYCLRQMSDEGVLPRRAQIFLDSPLAITATDIFRRFPEYLSRAARTQFSAGEDPFMMPGLHLTRSTLQSREINAIPSGSIILAGSGMATGGRVLHHLRYNLWRPESSVIFVGFAAEGTLARRIIDGAQDVHLFGEEVHVAARIYTINGFSAHADRDELLDWYGASGNPHATFLVHGEDVSRTALAAAVEQRGAHVELPLLHQSYSLTPSDSA
ncbi:MAG TPA: MBL fold metallo-hydrolase [Ktedonobacterales bacterium]|jgi:metallo-beta-lactamase family protein